MLCSRQGQSRLLLIKFRRFVKILFLVDFSLSSCRFKGLLVNLRFTTQKLIV